MAPKPNRDLMETRQSIFSQPRLYLERGGGGREEDFTGETTYYGTGENGVEKAET
jgi:hypothetical protein